MMWETKEELRSLFPVFEAFLINCHLIGVFNIVTVRGTPHFLLQQFALIEGLIPQIQFKISPSVCECESIPVNAFQCHSIEGAMKWKVKIPLEDWMCVRS